MSNNQSSIRERMAKYIHKELTKLRINVIKDIKIREKMALTCSIQKEFLTKKDFINPKYALKQLDYMIFAFEYQIRNLDKDWVRYKEIRKELIKNNLDPDKYVESERKKYNEISLKIHKKFINKVDKGMKLFAKHFSDLFLLEHYSNIK